MRLTFRVKLLLVIATAVATVVFIIIGGSVIDQRQQGTLLDVERRLVPKLEAGPRLTASFEGLSRSLQDAVAAQDTQALDATRRRKNETLELVAHSRGAFSEEQRATLSAAIEDYYARAFDVSRRMIQGEMGEALVRSVDEMQLAQRVASERIERATRLDRSELSAAFATARAANEDANWFRRLIGAGGAFLLLVLSVWVARSVLRPLHALSRGFGGFATGDFTGRIPILANDELGAVAREANQMASSLHALNAERERVDWVKTGIAGLSEKLRGELSANDVATHALNFVANRVGAAVGTFYVEERSGGLRLASQFAGAGTAQEGTDRETISERFASDQGLLGQAFQADELVQVLDVPKGYVTIQSSLGQAEPSALLFVPLMRMGQRVGIIELGLWKPCSAQHLEFIDSVREGIGVAWEVARSREELERLLARTRQQAETLTQQEEELRVSNQGLQVQQEELRQANDELEVQRRALSRQNVELQAARERVQRQVEELARVSSYKSQFLANMSHELRTPLNSMLLLSQLLSENDGGNLSPRQVEHCKTIHGAGQDLLTLINQVLDLAKIEAGKQDVRWEAATLAAFGEHVRKVFEPLASEKGLTLDVRFAPDLPAAIVTDRLRVERILTNLVGNAIKFTEHGSVAMSVSRVARPLGRHDADPQGGTIAFAISDTGIGISEDQVENVFMPFEQASNGGHAPQGGTGLGLAIARESASLLGGEITVRSSPGQGSTFTLALPESAPKADHATAAAPLSLGRKATIVDPQRWGSPYLLIVEDDPVLSQQLSEIVQSRGLEAKVAQTGMEGLELALEDPPVGIVLDIRLPDISGWEVFERLRDNPVTNGVPVHFLSALDAVSRGLALGAVGYLTKPVTRAQLADLVQTLAPLPNENAPRVLVVEDSVAEAASLMQLLRIENITATHVSDATGAFAALGKGDYTCIILDLGLPDMDGLGLLKALRERKNPPPRAIVHTGRALTKPEVQELSRYAEAVVLKDGDAPQRLLEEVRLFVHHLEQSGIDPSLGSQVRQAPDVSLANAKVLLVDDDMRNVYALSAFLRGKGAEVVVADTGKEALAVANEVEDLSVVIMDIMMPEMDGYEAIRRLREQRRFAQLPILALTARAMKGERERCLEAGASDYLHKPVDTAQLLRVLQHWVSGSSRVVHK